MNEMPFNGWDVWAVQLLGAVPLAASIAALIRGRVQLTAAVCVMLGAQLAILVGVPWIYRQARCEHDLRQLAGLLEQSRFGEARTLCQSIARRDRSAKLHDVPLSRVLGDLDRTVQSLSARAAWPLSADVDDDARIVRCQDLAMLGRTEEALHVLDSAAGLEDSPAACNLRGTIHESRLEWRLAGQWYARAKLGWQAQPASPERSAGLIRAATGSAFTERKLGRYAAAEAAYEEVLSLAPTADSHFLLAQFYDDTQQSAQAQMHARQAMAMDPERYTQPGQQLIDKLVALHFGCWGVRSAEQQFFKGHAKTVVDGSKTP